MRYLTFALILVSAFFGLDAQTVIDDFNDGATTGWTTPTEYTVTEAGGEMKVDFNITSPSSYASFSYAFSSPADFDGEEMLNFRIKTDNLSGVPIWFWVELEDGSGFSTNGRPYNFELITDGMYHDYCLDMSDRWFPFPPIAGVNKSDIVELRIYINADTALPVMDSIFMDEVSKGPRSTLTSGVLEDFECRNSLDYPVADGWLTASINNPDPNPVNSSLFVGQYTRNAGVMDDVLVGRTQGYLDLRFDNILKIDVRNPDTSHGVTVSLQHFDTLSGIYTDYGNITQKNTLANEWETLEFDFSNLRDTADVNSIILLFNVSTTTGLSYYFDNVEFTLGPPYAIISPDPASFCPGGAVDLSVPDGPGNTYQWYLAGSPISGATDSMYSATMAGNYSVIIDNGIVADTGMMTVTELAAPTPTITFSGGLLTASSATTYQWYLDSLAIPGATSMTYTPTADGNYYVEVTDVNGCTGTSPIETVILTHIDLSKGGAFSLFPNPTAGNLTVRMANDYQGSAFRIYDIAGRVMMAGSLELTSNLKEATIDVSAFDSGVYRIEIQGAEYRQGANFLVAK